MSFTTFGQWLKARRRELDLTQKALAYQVNCGAETIRKVEADRHRPSRELVEKLAQVLAIDEVDQAMFRQLARTPQQAPHQTNQQSSVPAAHRLPQQLPSIPFTSFIGRDADVQTLKSYLLRPEIHLLTLYGPAGVGKTRLASHLIQHLREHFADGCHFLSLTALTDASLVLPLLIQTIGIGEQADHTPVESLIEALHTRHMLLVLDNFEHVTAAAGELSTLLRACPGVKCLITSRAALHITGEFLFPVKPLDIPPLDEPLDAESLEQYTAVELFLQRARAAQPTFALTPQNMPLIAEICVRLDGLPLALELAATRINLLPPPALLSRLKQQLSFLSSAAPDAPIHQKSLQAALDWSYNLLERAEQQLFRQLAVFEGGFSIEAAASIVTLDDLMPSADTEQDYMMRLDGLAVLVDGSMLTQVVEDAEPRFLFLETVRVYALNQLKQAGEAPLLQARHAAYYLEQTELIDTTCLQDETTFQFLKLEYFNFRAALRWYIEQGNVWATLRLGTVLWYFWTLDGQHNSGQDWFRTTLSVVDKGLPILNVDPVARNQLFDTATSARASLDRVFGRDQELELLMRWLQPVLHKQGQSLITVIGEAGVGKSYLVAALRQRVLSQQRVRWLQAPADETVRQALYPIRQLLRQYVSPESDSASLTYVRLLQRLDALCAILPEPMAHDVQSIAPALAGLLGLPDAAPPAEKHTSPRLRFAGSVRALSVLLRAESMCLPVVLHLEDIHWFDEASLMLLRSMVYQLENAAVALLATTRPPSDADGPAGLQLEHIPIPKHTLTLQPLTLEAVQQQATSLLEGTISEELGFFLYQETRGNPFHLEHLILELHERQTITAISMAPSSTISANTVQQMPHWTLQTDLDFDFPRGLTATLIARLERLTAHAKQIVQTAAVLGREVEAHMLISMMESAPLPVSSVPEAPATTPRPPLVSGLLATTIRDLRCFFRHSLLRDAAYAMHVQHHLRELHELAGNTIEAMYGADLSTHASTLAYHYNKAGNTARERQYAWIAGVQAAEQFANIDALAYFERVLELTPPDDKASRYRILLARERIYQLIGAHNQQARDLAALTALASHLQDFTYQAEVALHQIDYHEAIQDYTTAVEMARTAIRFARTAQDATREAAGYFKWGKMLWCQGKFAESQTRLETALACGRAAGAEHVVADSLLNLGNVLSDIGNIHQSRTYYEEALSAYRHLGDLLGQSKALGNLGMVLEFQGDYVQSRRYYEENLYLCRELGYRRGESLVLNNLGTSYDETGDYDRARVYYEQALQICRELGDRPSESRILGNLGLLLLNEGEYQQAYQLCEQAILVAHDAGSQDLLGAALTIQGHILIAMDTLAQAHQAFASALDIRRSLGQRHLEMENLAGIAGVALRQQAIHEAYDAVKTILDYLQEHSLDGTLEPFRIYLICYQVLAAAQDQRAPKVLNQVQQQLQARALQIDDEALRKVFLERVPVHRELL